MLDEGTIVLVAFSDRETYPEEQGCVRADCIIAGWVIRPMTTDDQQSTEGSQVLLPHYSLLVIG